MNELLPCPFCGGPVDVEKTHIDTLEQTAAERVIADGSRGPTPDYTGEGSAWVPPVEEQPGVVRSLATRFGLFPDDVIEIARRVRAIPADRVLGEGMLSIHPDALNSISDALREIGDTAHNASTGPEVPDVLWGIRAKAYEAYTVATDAEAEIMQTANAHAALSSLRANQGGAAT